MSRNLLPLVAAITFAGSTAMADGPRVAVDIAPVHSLVTRVMDGVGKPSLIVQSGASPHQYSLRPSEAAALQGANLVFWMGEDLTPWLEETIDTLASDASVTTILEVKETRLLEFRDTALFDTHDHNDHDPEHDQGHDDHDHDEHADHDEHKHDEHADHDDHEHGTHDPHAWLSPQNAMAWLDVIAAELSAADPENKTVYRANAEAARVELDALVDEVSAILEPVRGGRFIVFHDAYQYFEADFDLPSSGAISLGDASRPSPARIAEIQGYIRDVGITCVLAEPQFNPGIVATVLDGTDARTAVIDPLGASLKPGAEFYPDLIRDMARSLASCL